ncbi:MAG: S8 family serine peptidase, partial [Lentimicrobiaceae bacterium]|nr:S8 family serine peptidase [Lentimicrobiaceae bacterium]
MKKIIYSTGLFFAFLSFCFLAKTQNLSEEPYYYYKGEKKFLTLNKTKLTITTTANFQKERIENIKYQIVNCNQDVATPDLLLGELVFYADPTEPEYEEVIHLLKNDANIVAVHPNFITPVNTEVGVSSYFHVRLKELSDYHLLHTIAEQKHAVIVKPIPFLPLWFTLRCTKETTESTLSVANYFYETGYFASAIPDFLTNDDLLCANDSDFYRLWGLHNEGNKGDQDTTRVDINACKAWQITLGKGVTVAVIDNGIQLDHIDLAPNISSLSYDTETHSSPSKLYWFHGTHVAGIIGAVKDNGIQVVGVAPESTLMSISNSIQPNPSSQINRASGINWAWENGADIINCSWGTSGIYVDAIAEAIDNALTLGRNGKGAIVVFASGNEYNYSIPFPANANSDILVVGAMDITGHRADFSNFGDELDIVAPGRTIFSTIPFNSADYMDGTSQAAPHVSGVAALVLSINPDLTGLQVRDIIETTAQKVRDKLYEYQPYFRPNGTWCEQMGYGLVDAYSAVLMAVDSKCNNGFPLVYGVIEQNAVWNTPLRAINEITIPSGVTLTITNTVYFLPSAKILVEPGGKLIINGGTLTSACEDEMWQGIVVMGNSSQPLQQPYQGYVQITNGGAIKNALCAITVDGGGMVNANNAYFMNNKKGVHFTAIASSQSGISGTFTQAQFALNSSYIGNPAFFEGHLKMESSGGVDVSDCLFSNYFTSNLNYGIMVENSFTNWSGTNQLISTPVALQTGATLTNMGSVKCNEHSTVTVHLGGKLHINGGTFTNATAGTMWQGITVMGDNARALLPQYQGDVHISNGGAIKNAITGITVQSGGMVTAVNALFENNKTGVHFQPISTPQTAPSGIFNGTNFGLDNNYFGTDFGALLNMDNCGEVWITGCNFSSATPLNQYNGVVVTNSATRWSGINQLLSVPVDLLPGAALTNTGTVKCNENSMVSVSAICKLTIDGGTFTSTAANVMWQGIFVAGKESAWPDPHGYVELKNGATVQNALTGIWASYRAIVEADNAYFINNKVGIQTGMRSDAQLSNTQFIINNNYPNSNLDFDVHLKLLDSKQGTVTKCTFLNETNQVNNNSPGIYSKESNIGIKAVNTCLHCKNSTFSGFYIALSASNTGIIPSGSIQNNNFTNNLSGVKLNAVNFQNVKYNQFDLTLNSAVGIYTSQSTGYTIEENSFLNEKSSKTIGVKIESSGSEENVIYKNNFYELFAGIQAIAVNSSQPAPPHQVVTGLQFLCNLFKESEVTDFVVGAIPGLSSPHGDHSVRQLQGGKSLPAGNQFFSVTNISNYSNYSIEYVYSTCSQPEFPKGTVGIVNTLPYNILSDCPSHSKRSGEDLEQALAQYNEWNEEYEYWLEKLLALGGDSGEEYNTILEM